MGSVETFHQLALSSKKDDIHYFDESVNTGRYESRKRCRYIFETSPRNDAALLTPNQWLSF